jgi:hypothetical protein
MARWSERSRARPRKPLWAAEGPLVLHFNVEYIDGFDGFTCGCEVDEDWRYLACMTCGRCEEHCDCLTDDSSLVADVGVDPLA